MEACRVLLAINGYRLPIDWEIIEIAERIAVGTIYEGEVADWIESRIIALDESEES
jgi:hypothetical protein